MKRMVLPSGKTPRHPLGTGAPRLAPRAPRHVCRSLPISSKPSNTKHLASNLLTGKLKLFLESASIEEWRYWSRRGIFDGFVTDPDILERDGVPCTLHALTTLVRAGIALGAPNVHVRVWGRSAPELVSRSLDIAGIDPVRVVVTLPCCDDGLQAANVLRDSHLRVGMTGLTQPHHVLLALACSVEYAEARPLALGAMDGDDAARQQAMRDVLLMRKTVTAQSSRLRVLAGGLGDVGHVLRLASGGIDAFSLTPRLAQALLGGTVPADDEPAPAPPAELLQDGLLRHNG